MAQIAKQLFSKDLQKNLYPDNSPFKNARLDIGVQADVANVEIPQAGAMPAIQENPSSFPLAVVERADDKKSYAVDLIVMPPVRIREHDNAILTYDKNKDVMEDAAAGLRTRVADKMAYVWTPAGDDNIVRTSGGATLTHLTGTTGNRKLITLDDFGKACTILDNMEVPDDGKRIALVSASMYEQLRKEAKDKFIGSDKLSSDLIAKGVVAMINNIHIYKRSRVCRFDNTGTPVKKIYTAANAVTDNDSILIWHPSFVRMAEGVVKVFYNPDRAEHLGNLLSAQVRAGGTIGRTDLKGVVSIVQSASA